MIRLACLFALLSPSTAPAQSAASLAEAEILPRIIDTLCIDMVEARIGCETAILVRGADNDADLFIVEDRRADDEGPGEILVVKRGIAFDGMMFGQAPALEVAGTSLRITSEQTGIGRNVWTQALTVAYRDGTFLAAGYTYTALDRLTLANATCDVNLLTGSWETVVERAEGASERREGRIEARRIALADWSSDTFPAPCRAALDSME